MVPIIDTVRYPAPANVPTAAEHQMVAAVSNPWMVKPSRIITPAPKKPIPLTICDAIHVDV